jgi:hypothetical protein
MTADDVFDLFDHAIEPEIWFCDDPWEYRAMHWRPREHGDPLPSGGAEEAG